jgi:hypothetical protein
MRAQTCTKLFAALTALAGTGCPSSRLVASTYVKQQLVPAAQGGTLTVTSGDSAQLAGTVVDIPAHALKTDTTITIGIGPADITPANATPVGPVVDLGPSGTSFTAPVRVTLPYTTTSGTLPPPDHLFVAVVEATGPHQRIENGALGFPSLGAVSFDVIGFSQFQVGLDSLVPDAGPCGGQCPSNSSCDGISQCVCDTGFTECASGPVCVNLGTDNANCGSCGSSCDVAHGYQCDFGDAGPVTGDGGSSCVCEVAGFRYCDTGIDGGKACIDVTSDQNNCGGCAVTCALHASCSSSACACDTGYDKCGASCVNLQVDNSNCGACNNVCDPTTGYACVSGACVCGAGSFGLCNLDGGTVCVDPTTNQHNCGGCGNDCAALQCVNAQCGCNPPLGQCGGVDGGAGTYCADLTTDNNNCGSCGNGCNVAGGYSCQSVPAGPLYVDGGLVDAGDAGVIYICACDGGGFSLCPFTSVDGGTSMNCTDTTTDPNNCGSCGTVCDAGSCSASVCQ